MAQIVINEISANYSYNIGTNSFATVALPITASWGPAFMDPDTAGISLDVMLEETNWTRFPATQDGLEAFVGAYRGPSANYRIAKDYSYQMAMTLLTAGYDVLVCRLCPGTMAQATFTNEDGGTFAVTAKYPGTFGNSLQVTLNKVANRNYWNLITYVLDTSGVRTAVENKIFVFDIANSTDTILHIDELESDFLTFTTSGSVSDDSVFTSNVVLLAGGSDTAPDIAAAADAISVAASLATTRYSLAGYTDTEDITYISAINGLSGTVDAATANIIRYNEWIYTSAYRVYDILKDKLSYSPQRIISPGWDDQNITAINGERVQRLDQISPLHIKLMDVAYYSRCATSLLDIPKCLPRTAVWNDSSELQEEGYAQMLARYAPGNAALDINGTLYQTHSALFAPWGQYTYVGTSKQNAAPPSFLALLIQRAMILNQSLQYEWALPTNRQHTLNIGKMDYTVNKKLLDEWQTLEGVGVNVITNIPDLGISLWGNSTLYEVPPATYQALSQLSTRYLVNAIENVAYRCGISITFNYSNAQAYDKFYAGVTPILDTMKSVGAIEDYYVRMSQDVNGLDRVNYNTVIGKIYIVVAGVINDIYIDLVCLPPGTDLTQFVQ